MRMSGDFLTPNKAVLLLAGDILTHVILSVYMFIGILITQKGSGCHRSVSVTFRLHETLHS